MADTTYYVDTDVVGGAADGSSWANAFATLAAAEALNLNLTTGATDGVCTINVRGNAPDTTAVTWNGWTTDAAGYVNVVGDVSGPAWDDTKYTLVVTDADALTIWDDHVRINKLQIRVVYSSVAEKSCVNVANIAAGGVIWIKNCFLRGDPNASATGYGIYVNDADATVYLANCIIYDHDSRGVQVLNCANVYVYNCVVQDCAVEGVGRDAGTVTVTNCAIYDTGDDLNGTITVDYCALDDADAQTHPVDETAGGKAWADSFTASATGDFTLKVGSPLIDAGADLSGTFTDDINGVTRSGTWDVGPDEYVAAGGSSALPAIMAARRRRA